jgi:AcrR family transcriptional regulator
VAKTSTRILETAVGLFKQYGYESVRIDDICKKAGITKSTFYYHYKSKTDLLGAFFDISDIEAEKQLSALLLDDNPKEQLWRFMLLYLHTMAEAGADVMRMMYIVNLGKRLRTVIPSDIHLKKAILILVKKSRPDLDDEGAQMLYDAIIYILDGIGLSWALSGGEFDFLEVCKANFNIILNTGLTSSVSDCSTPAGDKQPPARKTASG